MADIVGYKTSTGTIGTLKTQAALTFNYDVDYIDFTMFLDPPDDATRARGWFGKAPYFNGYHLSGQYKFRLYLDQGESVDIELQSGTSRDIINLLNGQFISLDTSFALGVSREEYVPEDSDSAVIVDSDYFPPDSEVFIAIDSNSLSFGNWKLEQHEGSFYITETTQDYRILRIDSDGTVNVDGLITENGEGIRDIIDSEVRVIVDSDYVQARQILVGTDSGDVVAIIQDTVDSDYVKIRQTDGGADSTISGGDY